MNEIAIVKHIMKTTGTSAATLADALGKTTASYVSNRLQSRTITVEKLLEILGELNCELVIRETRGEKRSFVVNNEDRQSVKNYKKDKKAGEE